MKDGAVPSARVSFDSEAPAPPLTRRMKLARAAERLGVARLLLGMRAKRWWPWPTLTVVMYHRVNYLEEIDGLDPELVDATPETFEAQLRFYRAHFSCVTVDAVIEAMGGGDPLPANPLLITFDDGYLDNYRHALPALQRTGTRAVFFVSTDFMARDKLFWWDRIGIIVRRAAVGRAVLSYPHELVLDLATPAGRAAAIAGANRIVKTTFGLDLERFITELARACQVRWSQDEERELAARALMGWDEVAALHRAGMQVQSHTRSHRVVTTLSGPELQAELVGARSELEQRLGAPVHAIAYPVGRPVGDQPHIRAALADAGYKLGFTTRPGGNRLGAFDPYDVRRLTIDRCLSKSDVQALAVLPWLAQ